jgi:histidinol-phosphate aminotransferase
MSFERKNIAKMQGYVPGEQPKAGCVIKLNTNENPYPASPLVAQTLAKIKIQELRRYPTPTAQEFRETAAKIHEINPQNIVPVNGGDELLRLALTTFVDQNDTVAITKPSYSLYSILAKVQGCSLQEIALLGDFTLPENFLGLLNEVSAKMCILVNPHSPTGSLLSTSFIDELASRFSGVLVIDEAYIDFVDPTASYDSVPLINKHKNLLLLRTFSKGYSLAGLRFGYGIADSELIDPIMYKTRDSYNTDYVSQKLATAALLSRDYAKLTWEKIRRSREDLVGKLHDLGLKTLPSQSNFLLSKMPDEVDAKTLCQRLKERNILVRYFNEDMLQDKIRISIGSDEENKLLISSLQKILST